MYGALLFMPLLWYGAIHGFYNTDESSTAGRRDGIRHRARLDPARVNAFLLMMYTFSCHSFRHFVGGGLDCFSCSSCTRDAQAPLGPRHRLEREPPALRLVQPGLDRLYGPLHPPGRERTINDPNTWGF